ncbi:cytochrome P450 [Lenzites betulinus]|nr:cytochrome P450 [Lenzites betulinus]
MSPLLLLFVAFFVYGVWRLVCEYVLPSSLDKVPGPASKSLLLGNVMRLFDHNNEPFLDDLIYKYGPVSKFHGFVGAIHSILMKDQELYTRGSVSITITQLILGPGLLSTTGARHRRQRKMLNPVFSATHMRNMIPFFHDIVSKLRDAIESRVITGEQEVDIAAWISRTALELIGQGGLGHSFDPLTEETSDACFVSRSMRISPAFNEIQWVRIFLPYIKYLGPAWLRRKLLDAIPNKQIQRVKYISDVVYHHSAKIFNERKEAAYQGDTAMVGRVGAGKDVMTVLLKANMAASEEDKLPDQELIAQMSTFINAGVDTTSNALARTLHLLAMHPRVQDKLHEELIEAQTQYGDRIPYDQLTQLPYMDAVCRETLRLAEADTTLPLMTPIRGIDGKLITEIAVPKGTFLVLNLKACDTMEALWGDDAREWKPERWLAPLPHEVEDARIPGVYSHLMTFGAGSYSCIGFKFSQLEMKVVLSTLVRDFKFSLPDKPIQWKYGGLNYPTMGGPDSTKAEMLLKVERVRE